jgi:hypothetical protein
MNGFTYKSWTVFDAIDALMAHDHGATDSGVADDGLRAAVFEYIASLDGPGKRRLLATYARRFLTDEAIAQGYGLDDVAGFIEWVSEVEAE